jgi:hypothetical protein
MIRALIALNAGLILGALFDWAPIRAIRRAYCRLKLHYVLLEIVDICDDITDAMHDRDHLLAEGLTDFYTQLCNERDELRVKLRYLS